LFYFAILPELFTGFMKVEGVRSALLKRFRSMGIGVKHHQLVKANVKWLNKTTKYNK